MPIYRCKNYGNCDLADKKEPIEIAPGMPSICPNEHCQKPLVEAAGGGTSKRSAESRFGNGRTSGPTGAASKLPYVIVGVLLLLIAGAAWFLIKSEPNGSVSTPIPGSKDHRVLRMEGSNTIGSDLGPELARAFLEKKYPGAQVEVTKTVVDESDSKKKYEKYVLQANQGGNPAPISFVVTAKGSGDAFKALVAGSADFGMSSRRIKKEEIDKLAQFGDMTSLAHEHVIGTDGVAVIVNRDNDVPVLTLDQVAEIFSGRVSNWAEVGGRPGAITVYARNDESGTFGVFDELVLKPRRVQIAGNASRFADSSTLSDNVAADPTGVGFIGLPYVRNAKAVSIAPARGLIALLPDPRNVATDDYALSRNLYLYTTKTDPLIEDFLDFVYSPAGEDVIAKYFISLRVDAANVSTPADATSEYARTVAGAQRLNVNFRFLTKSDQINNKSSRSLESISRFMARPENNGRQLILLGFSDQRGGASAYNCKLSVDRAMSVRRHLEERGMDIRDARGFCDAMPLSLIDDEDGWQRNRRVEVWIR